jgi:hypothetical protein
LRQQRVGHRAIGHAPATVFARWTGRPQGPPGGMLYLTLAPTTASQFLVIASFDLPCSSSVGNTAAFVGFGRRQLGHHVRRELAVLGKIVEADRVAIALEPADLAFVGIEVFHPELGCVRVRRKGADRLHVDAGDDAGLRNDDVDGRIALQRVAAGKRVVVPGHQDRRLALGKRRRLADDRHEIAGGVQLLEEVETSGAGSFAGGSATGKTSGVDSLDGLVGGARVAGKGNGVGKFGLQQISPVGRRFLDEVLVHQEGEHAVVVAGPEAIGVLGAVRDRVPGGDLVGLDQAVGLGGRAEGQADVDDVGRLRALVVLVGLDGLDLVAGAGIGVEFVDGDVRILRLEAGDDVAVATPVMRQGDGGELAFLLRRGNQFIHGLGRRDSRGRHEGDGRKGKQFPREFEHVFSPLN